jgi:hypothetical protein
VKSQRLRVKGPAGWLEMVLDEPAGERRGLALVAHPHPLHGGSLDNKVAQTLARAANALGLSALRPNFRGVGGSEGAFDHGQGETDDLLALATLAGQRHPGLPWLLLGFSFGAYVQHRVAQRLAARRMILVGPAVTLYAFDPPACPTEIIHGAEDELIPLATVRTYAERHGIPLHVLPGAGHFFHGRLGELRARVEDLCRPSFLRA